MTKLSEVTQPTSGRAGIHINARVFTLHLWSLGRAWHFRGWLLTRSCRSQFYEERQAWAEAISIYTGHGKCWATGIDQEARLRFCSKMRANWTMTDGCWLHGTGIIQVESHRNSPGGVAARACWVMAIEEQSIPAHVASDLWGVGGPSRRQYDHTLKVCGQLVRCSQLPPNKERVGW